MMIIALIFFTVVSVLAALYYFKVIRPVEKEQKEYFRKNETNDFRNF